MHHNRLIGLLFVLSAGIAYLHITALQYFWYWRFPWFDILMHFLGGALIAGIILWVRGRFLLPAIPWNRIQAFVLTGVFIVGVGWELFEWFFGLTKLQGYYVDTVTDLIMDVVGAWVLFVLIRPKGNREIVPTASNDSPPTFNPNP